MPSKTTDQIIKEFSEIPPLNFKAIVFNLTLVHQQRTYCQILFIFLTAVLSQTTQDKGLRSQKLFFKTNGIRGAAFLVLKVCNNNPQAGEIKLKFYNLVLPFYIRQVYKNFVRYLQQKRRNNNIRRIHCNSTKALDNAKLGLP